jgi:hypothetical protein
MDPASRSIAGRATSANIDAALVTKALDRAVANRKPHAGKLRKRKIRRVKQCPGFPGKVIPVRMRRRIER